MYPSFLAAGPRIALSFAFLAIVKSEGYSPQSSSLLYVHKWSRNQEVWGREASYNELEHVVTRHGHQLHSATRFILPIAEEYGVDDRTTMIRSFSRSTEVLCASRRSVL